MSIFPVIACIEENSLFFSFLYLSHVLQSTLYNKTNLKELHHNILSCFLGY